MKTLRYSIAVFGFTLLLGAFDASADSIQLPLTKAGEDKVFVFDLDDTLFDTRSRTHKLLVEFASSGSIKLRWPKLAEHIKDHAKLEHVRYGLDSSLKKVGILESTQPGLVREWRAYWKKHFFSNRAVLLDEPMPGAVEYVQSAHVAGSTIVYLTGRDEPRMGNGTRQALEKHGFPFGDEKTLLLLKDKKERVDLDFKKSAFIRIRTLGEVIGCFDNEPGNIVAFKSKDGFPNASVFFLDTQDSGLREKLVGRTDIIWLTSFEPASL